MGQAGTGKSWVWASRVPGTPAPSTAPTNVTTFLGGSRTGRCLQFQCSAVSQQTRLTGPALPPAPCATAAFHLLWTQEPAEAYASTTKPREGREGRGRRVLLTLDPQRPPKIYAPVFPALGKLGGATVFPKRLF